jgi:16S rRNA (cytosine1402-N4)-methyltransferase
VVRSAQVVKQLPENHRAIWDGTLGLGGHLAALNDDNPTAPAFGSDADAQMLALAEKRLGDRGVTCRRGNFSEDPFSEVEDFGFILLDLGISSAHFDFFERGFSFRFDQPLDMRMDTSLKIGAAEIVSRSSEEELAKIFFEYGEERHGRRIARAIIAQRQIEPIQTTSALAAICEKIYPPRNKAKGHAQKHPATRVFQALRIAVNKELDVLDLALRTLPHRLAIGGRFAIISFHSLEDRRVKHAFRELSQIKESNPLAKSNYKPGDFALIDAGGIVPEAAEIAENPRARSARLRVLERLR